MAGIAFLGRGDFMEEKVVRGADIKKAAKELEKPDEYFRALEKKFRKSSFKPDIFANNLKQAHKLLKKGGLSFEAHRQLVKEFVRLGVLQPDKHNEGCFVWTVMPDTVSKLYFGKDTDSVRIRFDADVHFIKDKLRLADPDFYTSGTESAPVADETSIVLPASDGFMMRVIVPPKFTRADFTRLIKVIEACVID